MPEHFTKANFSSITVRVLHRCISSLAVLVYTYLVGKPLAVRRNIFGGILFRTPSGLRTCSCVFFSFQLICSCKGSCFVMVFEDVYSSVKGSDRIVERAREIIKQNTSCILHFLICTGRSSLFRVDNWSDSFYIICHLLICVVVYLRFVCT